MKKTITLTKLLTLAALLVTFTTASASFGGDEKCKSKSCKSKKNKEVAVAMAELEKAMNKLEAELKTVTAFAVTTEVNQSLQKLQVFSYRPVMVAYAPVTEISTTVDTKYRFNFNNMNAEMDKEQEKMTTAPEVNEKIDFSNMDKAMNETQEKMTRLETTKS